MSRDRPAAIAALLVAGTALVGCTSGPLHGEGTPCDEANPCRSFLACDVKSGTCLAARHTSDAAVANPPLAEGDAGEPPSARDAQAEGDADGRPATRESLPYREGELAGDPPVAPARGVGGPWPVPVASVCWEKGRLPGDAGSDMPARLHPAFAAASARIRDALGVLSRPARQAFAMIGNLEDPRSQECLSTDPAENRQQISVWFGSGPAEVIPSAEPSSRAARVKLDPASPTLLADAIESFAAAAGVPLARTPARTGLLSGEIFDFRERFGFKPPGALVTPSGLCLDVRPSGTDAPPLVQVATCDPRGARQSFHYEASADFAIWDGPNAPNETCLDRASSPPGALTAASCAMILRQPFEWSGVLLRGSGDLCVAADEKQAGARLSLRSCDAGAIRWDVVPLLARQPRGRVGRIALRLAGTDLCIDEDAAATPATTAPSLQPCADRNPFVWLATGELRFGTRCLYSPGTRPAAAAMLWGPCSGIGQTPAQGQRFHLTGVAATMDGGDCLDVADPLPPLAGAGARLAPCDDRRAANQTWDYAP